METANPKKAMERARDAFAASGLSLEQLGQRMGYEEGAARRSAWQFLNKTADPRLSMLARFSSAVGVPIADLVTDSAPTESVESRRN